MLHALAALLMLGSPAAPPVVPVVEVTADLAALATSERAALVQLLGAAALMDQLFLRQVWAGNEPLALALAASNDAMDAATLRQLRAEKGPWLRRQRDRPFVKGIGEKPPVGSFYPANTTRAELESWLAGLDADAHAAATSPVTTVRRAPGGSFTVVPYSRAFQPELALAAGHLRRAAALTQSASLRGFLEQRATAFASNDYHASDLAWMNLDGPLEPTIGPYEIYEDGWFNAKADFQAVIALRHAADSALLQSMQAQLQDLEDQLPLAPGARTANVLARKGAQAPLRIVDVVLATGDVHRALDTGSFLLPNDDRITAQLGGKRTLLRNVHEARWRTQLQPLAQRLLAPGADAPPRFETFFTHLVVHELMHLLGPREITVAGHRTSVGERLQETHGAIEEAKAEVTAVLSMGRLAERGVLPARLAAALGTSFVTGLLHTLRAGTAEPRGQAAALVLNTLLDRGGVRLQGGKAARLAVQPGLQTAVAALAAELLALQAAGDRGKAAALLKAQGRVRPEVQRALDGLGGLGGLPVEIDLRFVTGEKLLRQVHGR